MWKLVFMLVRSAYLLVVHFRERHLLSINVVYLVDVLDWVPRSRAETEILG